MSKKEFHGVFVILGTAALACLAGSCTEDTPCDDGQVLNEGMCYAATPDAAAPSSPDALVESEAGTSSAAFGKTCTTSAECAAPADFCATPPGNCTSTGCEVDPTVCPPTWTCFDLTPYGTALHICIPPM
jgi:hypothetical protein